MEELGPRTLLVDDEEPIRQVPLFAARLADYTKHQVGKGGEALRSFQLVQPDLIRLDLDLPDIVGKEVIRCLRRRGSRPIVAISVRAKKPRRFTLLIPGSGVIRRWHLGCKVSRVHLAKGSRSETRSLLSPPRGIQ
jgi:CheY-like chemotaxis protein